MNTKNNKKAQKSISQLKKSLLSELRQKELKDIKIKSLCECAKINRTTFYAHFDSVEDVLYEMCEEYIYEVYKVFQNKDLDYKQKIKNSIIIIKNNLEYFEFFFKHVHNIEERILTVVQAKKNNTNNDITNIKTMLSLVFIISGFVGIGKMYLTEFNKNPKIKLNIDEFTDLVYNSINKTNPYFEIK